MDNPRPEKVAVVDEVRERMSSSSAVLLTEYRGMKVSEIATLRRNLRDAGGDYKIYKNTLVRFAARDLGLEGVEELLVGPTAVAFVDGDVAAVAKALRDFSRTNPNLIVKGGVLGSKALSADDAKALAELPSREVLLARIAGGLAAPMVQFAGLLQALPRNMAYGLKALIDQRIEGGEAAPAPAADEAPAEAAPETEAAPAAEAETTEAAPAADETTDAAPAAEADETPAEAPVAEAEAPAATSSDDAAAEADTTEEAPEAETAEEA
ncbi:MAG: ribosomal protein [Actinomycetia bacterium]|nr:ribosomal protein [Actinomycetes bacterium]